MKQLTVKDMILTGALSALYCIGVGLGTLLAVLIFRSANMVEAPAVAALICGASHGCYHGSFFLSVGALYSVLFPKSYLWLSSRPFGKVWQLQEPVAQSLVLCHLFFWQSRSYFSHVVHA